MTHSTRRDTYVVKAGRGRGSVNAADVAARPFGRRLVASASPTRQAEWLLGWRGPSTLRRMRDIDIRVALDEKLRAKWGDRVDAVVRHELGVCAGERRVDVALINGHLDGWEIKSDRDSLTRLAGQVEAYSKVLDRSWLVTTDRHLGRAMDVVPGWWGLARATATATGVKVIELRRPRQSPLLDSMATAQLLWRDEAMGILRRYDLAAGLGGKARWYVWERLVASFSMRQLRGLTRDALRARPEWPGGQLPS